MRKSLVMALSVAAGAVSSASCLDHELAPDTQENAVFIALQRDFDGFEAWSRLDLGEREHAGLFGPTRLYYNRLPPPGLEKFPVGTMLVKSVEAGDPVLWTVHAMVKRGGGFNQNGAFDWEFFDLRLDTQRTPAIVWRGQAPPSGEGYGTLTGDENGNEADCNTCHQTGANDAVLTEDLDLDRL